MMSGAQRVSERVVVVGAGVVGASVACPLTRPGHDDVVVLDAWSYAARRDRPPASWDSSAPVRS
ncbi:hypothetical protein HEK131_29280 [Streptomyces seoulensis]|nr:hypothetical protein HEK131_29280 [Streptomyces seoulensis]